jgi:pyruvate dehydrogenase E2 component (dihydrolipoyllysine-residue acetyltransferase)
MPTPFIMPKFDMDQEDATIASWEKEEGDFVKADETVLVVETSKVAIDVPAPATGTLAGIRFKQGDVVPVTTVIAYILKQGETLADLPRDAMPAAASLVAAPVAMAAGTKAEPGPTLATPVAARMAKENGIDLAKVPAEGERIRREDVERYLINKTVDRAPAAVISRVNVAATPAARRMAREAGVTLEGIQGSGPGGRVQSADIAAAAETKRPETPSQAGWPAQIVPLVGMRHKIAERMTSSFHDIPHISLTVEADASALESAREQLTNLAEMDGPRKITLTALLVKIVAWALARNPYLNASLLDDKIHLWQDVNIGVATALPDGLIVPVIHRADQLSVRELGVALADLTTRAKGGKLGLADVQHPTFTISNLGMFGIRQFRAVINPPESAILAIGAVVRKPIVINERDEVAVRPVLTLTLSADHRVIDGAVAARFLQELVQGIETPALLLY